MALTDDNRWRVMRPQRLRLRRWDDEVVVYDDWSGDTHILDNLAGEVLECLMHASADTATMIDDLLVSSAELPENAASRQRNVAHLHDALRRLRLQGIIKPVVK